MSNVEVKRFLRKRKEYLTEKEEECDANKEKSSASTRFPLQVIKHRVLGVLNFKGQVIKIRVLKSKPNMAGSILNPKTDRAKLKEVLPKFYEAECYEGLSGVNR